ncbi:MAG: ABC transporter permease [Planctomycetia bacterium]|nr:ABC transporter permease [Planctomycetia bacterium]
MGIVSYGMLPVLLLLCIYFSVRTYSEQQREGADAGRASAAAILKQFGPHPCVVIVAQKDSPPEAEFVTTLQQQLRSSGATVAATSIGDVGDARRALKTAVDAGKPVDVVACTQVPAAWPLWKNLAKDWPNLGKPKIMTPPTYMWPNFLTLSNLSNITERISVIAIIAIGMTMVIITGGIDLSVGSLIALSAVVSTLLIQNVGGGQNATPMVMILSSFAGIAVCGLMGLFSGAMVTVFRLPAFIVTLSMMLIARGIAQKLTHSEAVADVPASYKWLGLGADLFNIPNCVVLLLILYAVAYVLMHYTVLGRYIYAVGGNSEAARLSGVPVLRVIIFTYVLCGLLSGVGGVVLASKLKSGSANYALMYELYAIAAVVVGGTSLAGGEGKILGTLIGALIMAVIQTGMLLTNVDLDTQNIVLGVVILLAVLFDAFKRSGFRFPGLRGEAN